MTEGKKCTKCGIEKDIEMFVRNRKRKDGIGSWCKECARISSIEYRINNPEKASRSTKKWRENNKEHMRSLVSEWEKNNKDKRKKSHQKWIADNPEKHAESNRRRTARMRKKYPHKFLARNIVNSHLRSGKIQMLPCAGCGTMDHVEAHHEDYDKPLDIIWLCRGCHRMVHREN